MGGKPTKTPDQSTHQSQANHNNILDQDNNALVQFNWASFGGGATTVIVFIALCIALLCCWRYNRRANRKLWKAELHEVVALTRQGGSGGFPGTHVNTGQSGLYPGAGPPSLGQPFAPGSPGTQSFFGGGGYGGPQASQLAASPHFAGGSGGMGCYRAPVAWTTRIREIREPVREVQARVPRVTYVDEVDANGAEPVSILRPHRPSTPRAVEQQPISRSPSSASLAASAPVPDAPAEFDTGLSSYVRQ